MRRGRYYDNLHDLDDRCSRAKSLKDVLSCMDRYISVNQLETLANRYTSLKGDDLHDSVEHADIFTLFTHIRLSIQKNDSLAKLSNLIRILEYLIDEDVIDPNLIYYSARFDELKTPFGEFMRIELLGGYTESGKMLIKLF